MSEIAQVQNYVQDVTEHLRAWFGDSSGIAVRTINGVCPLFPEEEAYLQRAVTRRRQEFSTGRWCARKALIDLGIPLTPILLGRWREPLWPVGIVGSISHSAEVCAAVVVQELSWAGIGIDLLDAETAGNLPGDVADFIISKEEEHGVEAFASPAAQPLALLI